jgi:hypothetical protein
MNRIGKKIKKQKEFYPPTLIPNACPGIELKKQVFNSGPRQAILGFLH